MDKVRRHFILHGCVQGLGFPLHCLLYCTKLWGIELGEN